MNFLGLIEYKKLTKKKLCSWCYMDINKDEIAIDAQLEDLDRTIWFHPDCYMEAIEEDG